MATGTCEVLERDLECPEAIEELPVRAERIPRLSREDVRKDAEVLQSEEEVNSSSLGIEKEERNTLHVIEKDLDEFVESITDTPVVTEKTVTRVERVEETASSASPQVPKTLPVKRQAEPRTIGPMKEEVPWEGLTLNKCILIASFVALLSMGFQVFQDVIDVDEVPEAEPSLWAQPARSLPEDGAGKRGELWFFKSWLSWLEPEEAEDPEAKVEGMQQDSPGRAEPRRGQKPSALEKEVEKPRESVVAQPERGVKEMKPKDRPPEGQASKMHRAPPAGSEQEEEEEEGQQRSSKRARGEGKEGKRREGKERPRRDEGKGRHPKPDSPPQGPGRKEHRHDESGKRDSKQHKGRKPWEQHKFKESKRHD
ncbi:junctional sarcoplasmic reticulum protein 1 [Terrapene carolina triunguis]|uniref:junctional sarcoplasmic reticulum protein 1 n=1 Tax=Terrapene triunguis TaxID=2587831 RepID=UPI000CEFF901|nr:junctional sarcoplasmic reticulum protein 1 [Terrapene carolina triunguis]XP_024059592.1 junctional sarcoplasmic reticulum protein 1 [Terrapene carolina triunguis]XP_024059593.1 junctional sarcoplasmic reticulum protein 1 [Terrapene carolina triunguis]XP_024059594.1 junctional sarcoplasmic reticulum protein 1 [Terrapene carolina triunguis]XP_024059595.1 junctional sarcoplasmic reticulum protein 1 [Terrapene carolina triunguis]